MVEFRRLSENGYSRFTAGVTIENAVILQPSDGVQRM